MSDGAEGRIRGNILVVAFEGWTDAGEASSSAVRHLRETADYEKFLRLDSEKYLDYQFSRPKIRTTKNGKRRISFPKTTVFKAKPGGYEGNGIDALHLLLGVEPARNWKRFAAEIVNAVVELDIDVIIFLGATLADVPHTRPISAFVVSEDPEIRGELGLERGTYEGPIGINSVIAQYAEIIGVPTVSVWASVPHYAHNSPSPKATLSLLQKLTELTGVQIHTDHLVAEAALWETTIDSLTIEDEEIAGYIRQLEQARDAVDSPRASGDAIAEEFEKYLRGNDGKDGKGDQSGPPVI